MDTTNVWIRSFCTMFSGLGGMAPPVGPDGRPSSWAAVARELLAQIDPRDPLEELLAAQILHTHARVLFFSRHAHQQKTTVWFDRYSNHFQQSAELFRRQMLALAEYRGPRRRRARTTVTTVHDETLAQILALPIQEVADVAAAPPADQAPLPPEPGRPAEPDPGDPHVPTVDE